MPALRPDTVNPCVAVAPGPNDSDEYVGDAGVPPIDIFGTNDPDVPPIFVHVTLTATVQVPCLQGFSLGVIVMLVARYVCWAD